MFTIVTKAIMNRSNGIQHRIKYAMNPYTNKLIQVGGKVYNDLLNGSYLSEWIVEDNEYNDDNLYENESQESEEDFYDYESEKESEFKVHDIIEYDNNRYLVKWFDNSTSYEPIENLSNCKELLEEFNSRSRANRTRRNWIRTSNFKKQRISK
jgi:hypothetical protein